jgi:beta-lactamase class A
MGKNKLKQDTIRQWQEKKRRNRWMVAVVFWVMVGGTLAAWWYGSLGKEIGDYFKAEPVVWKRKNIQDQKLNIKNTNQITKIDVSELERDIEALIEGLQGNYVVYGKKLTAKSEKVKSKGPAAHLYWEFSVGEVDQVMQAASLTKVPVMVAVYRMAERGDVDLDSIYKLREEDRIGGSGSLVGKPVGYEVSLRKLVWHMGNESDNTAFTAIVNMFGEKRLEDEFLKLGLLRISISENEITPAEVAELFEGLYSGRWLTRESSGEILNSMVETWYEDRIPEGIKGSLLRMNYGGHAGVTGVQESSGVKVAHKVGTEIGVVGDAGIIYSEKGDYLLVIMSEGVREVEAKEAVVEISRKVWEGFVTNAGES